MYIYTTPSTSFVTWLRSMGWACRAAVNSVPWKCWGGQVHWSDLGCSEKPSVLVTSCLQFLLCSASDTPTASMKGIPTNGASTRFKRQVICEGETHWFSGVTVKSFLLYPRNSRTCWLLIYNSKDHWFTGATFIVELNCVLINFVILDRSMILNICTDVELACLIAGEKPTFSFVCLCVMSVWIPARVLKRLPGICSLREISRRAAYASRRPRHDSKNGKLRFPYCTAVWN